MQSLAVPEAGARARHGAGAAETGTQNHEGIVGVRATVDFLATLDGPRGIRREGLRHAFAALHEQGQRHTRALWDGLSRVPGLRLYGVPPSQPRTPTIAFTIEGMTSEEIARALAERAVFVSHGDFYAATLIERLGVEGVVRIGCACYTTDEEVERAIEAVSTIARPAAVRIHL